MMQLTQIVCLGLSHHSAPVALRERLSCALLEEEHRHPADLPESYAALAEIVMLTTCNRIELYACVSGEDVANGRQLLMNYLGTHHSADVSELREYLYYYQGQPAIEHLVRVSCGLDSQILGEPQILGQVTTAFMKAVEAGTIGPALTALFRGAIRAGKRARADTEISSNPLSIGSASITLADKLIGPLHRRNVLVVGLGEMGQLAINALHKRGVQQIALANRTRARAEELAKSWNGAAYGLDELTEAISRADVVITATAAPETIVDANLIERAMNGRGHRDLVIIDIALPRNVSSDARNVPRVHLFNTDDLRQTLDGSLEARRREIPRVEAIISQELSRLQREFKELAISPTIVDLRQKAEAIRQQELQRTLRYIGDDVDPQTLRHIQLMTRALVNKLLHEPTTRLREQASNGNAERYAEIVRDLFDLDPPGNGDAGSNE